MQDQFLAGVEKVLGAKSREYACICKAVELVWSQEGEKVIDDLYEAVLAINLINAASSISNARSVTSSYRMTNKPCRFGVLR